MCLWSLITADMDKLAREDFADFIQDILDILKCLFLRRKHIALNAPLVHHRRCKSRDVIVTKIWIARNGSTRVPGNLDLRDNRDMALCRESNHIAALLLRVETAVPFTIRCVSVPIRWRTSTPCADFGQLWILFGLKAPALIFGQVPVKDIQLVKCHPVEELLNVLHRKEPASDIELNTAPTKGRLIIDADT